MKNNPIISIIVPVYNVEKYLPYCLKSIQNQTFTDFECILIDDGSTDSSGTLCDKISQEDSRFKVIHQENQGEVVARNHGLQYAKGYFIFFTDSDDYIHAQILEVLYKTLINNHASFSMVLGKRVYSYDNKHSKLEMPPNLTHTILSQNELIKRLFGNSNEDFQYQVLWNKLYPKVLIDNIHLNKTASEDTDFNLRVFLQSKSAVFINSEMYYWVQRSSSLTHAGINKRFIDILDSYYNMYQIIPKEKEKYRAYCIYKLYKRILNVRFHSNSNELKEYAIKKIKQINKATFKDLYTNRYLTFKNKATISILYHFPLLYKYYMKYCNLKAKIK